MTIRTVLFDLDGTLADTAPDLAAALNHALEQSGRPSLPFETIRPVVSHGAVALLRLGFGLEPGDSGYDEHRTVLLDFYRANIAVGTRLFPGMAQVLESLETRGIGWGVVTNKPAWLTEPLLAELGIAHRACAVVSGDTLPERKPHPAPLLHACTLAGRQPSECLYVGDAERDIEAGRRAGMPTLAAAFGYLAETDEPARWGADAIIQHPTGILDWLAGDSAEAGAVFV